MMPGCDIHKCTLYLAIEAIGFIGGSLILQPGSISTDTDEFTSPFLNTSDEPLSSAKTKNSLVFYPSSELCHHLLFLSGA